MRYYFLLFVCCVFFNSCRSSGNEVRISVEHLNLDSVGLQLSHYMTGQEILDTMIPVADYVAVSGLPADMYIVTLRWPRTYIPHHYLKNRSFQDGLGTQYMVNKTFYIDSEQQPEYKFSFDHGLQVEEIEMNEVGEVNIDYGACENCKIADRYWKVYTDFLNRKDSAITKLSENYYSALAKKDTSSRRQYQQIEAYKSDVNTDDLFLNQFDQLTSSYSNNPVSSFFVYFQSNMDSKNNRYRANFEQLKGDAVSSPYYQKIAEKQRDK
ncbi:hypothetical protein GQF61_10570 [Sphingobacterium sp. DK4209]|uniref:DUF4369 domain-containing protein n=1 Tax=Sphingobacterium zhuxiongii TaxID=2662364 RepID=A0A5Q0Q755_9SPHI|nr:MULTISPECIES: hypothetical protein [unclassified Sphingobacterium]MVZ66302.1 hypothetical protein [Sphingobacterium sp. DK4209]QGA25084.1 hypothetical protein GFH32_01540 [Sphingobacterium sp. dk4302]